MGKPHKKPKKSISPKNTTTPKHNLALGQPEVVPHMPPSPSNPPPSERTGQDNTPRWKKRAELVTIVVGVGLLIVNIFQMHYTETAANAAESAAKTAANALAASIAASHLDLRPLVVLSKMKLSQEPRAGKPFSASGLLMNAGKTAAIHAYVRSTTGFWSNDLPQPIATDLQSPDSGHRSSELIAPGNIGETHFYTDPKILTAEQVAAYRAGTFRIYILARVDYEDVFSGTIDHWTNICVWFASGRPLDEFGWCEKENEMDQEKAQ